MTIIDTKHAPGAIGPYSQAYETNGLVKIGRASCRERV